MDKLHSDSSNYIDFFSLPFWWFDIMLVNLIRASGNRYTKISNKTRNVK